MKTQNDILHEWMIEAYDRGYNDARTLLKYPKEIISFIDSCSFDSEQLQCIARAVEDMKWTDYEGNPDDYDRTEELREHNWEFDKQ